MSDKVSSGKITGAELKEVFDSMAPSLLGKDTTETHKSTTIIETKVEGAGKTEKELKRVSAAAKEMQQQAKAASAAFKDLETHLKTPSNALKASFYNKNQQDAKEGLSVILADYFEKADEEVEAEKQAEKQLAKYNEKISKARKNLTQYKKDAKKSKKSPDEIAAVIGDKEAEITRLLEEKDSSLEMQDLTMIRQEKKILQDYIKQKISSIAAMLGKEFSMESLIGEVDGLDLSKSLKLDIKG